jgi:hypothetical protein
MNRLLVLVLFLLAGTAAAQQQQQQQPSTPYYPAPPPAQAPTVQQGAPTTGLSSPLPAQDRVGPLCQGEGRQAW